MIIIPYWETLPGIATKREASGQEVQLNVVSATYLVYTIK